MPQRALALAIRNKYKDMKEDYISFMVDLQLDPEFYTTFFQLIKQFRFFKNTRKSLLDIHNEMSIKEISVMFLEQYGRYIWLRKGQNNHQDPKFNEQFFQWDEDKEK
jgi:hypothetical protein